MKEKIIKVFSVLKKDGLISTIGKIFKYIQSRYLIKINIFEYLYIKLNKRKFTKMLDDIFESNNFERIIIWRSTFGWNVPLFQRPQHIFNNLAKQKCLIFYEVTKMTDKVNNIKKASDNLYLVNFNNSAISKMIFNKIKESSLPKYIQFYSTDTNMSLKELLQYIDNGFKIIYEYIDDLSPQLLGTNELPKNLVEKYEYMLKDTENVFVVVTADEIKKDVVSKRGEEKLTFSCNGVDMKHFQNIDAEFNFELEYIDILKQNKPIIGYYGALATWFDYDLIKNLAESRKEYNIVLFGIKYDESLNKAGLEKYDNIYYMGCRNYSVLQNYADKFNVCTIPFLINSITQATSPVKLFEYMALGKPIVTTAMNECKKYKSVMIANNKQEFIKLIDKAIKMNKNDDSDYFNELKNEALENTWEAKSKNIIELLSKYE